ncbi:MAG: ferredoxin [Subtercola sp.]|nr:ferredoxin [Subtercola sp.]
MLEKEKVMSETRLKYVIDDSICSGHGRCYVLAPQSFTADEIGYGQVIEKTYSLQQRQEMENLVVSCPEGAISIETVEVV